MRRVADLLAVILAVAIFVLIARGAVPGISSGPLVPATDDGSYYHPGKNRRTLTDRQACIAEGCHGDAPHKRDKALAPFRNLHAIYVACPVCHAPDGSTRFTGSRDGNGRVHLRYTGSVPATGPKGHPPLGNPGGCRRCHSEPGMRSLKEHGLSTLPPGYADPIALRMHEGGARQWNP